MEQGEELQKVACRVGVGAYAQTFNFVTKLQ